MKKDLFETLGDNFRPEPTTQAKHTTTGICANCGADAGLHHYDTQQCPRNGIEETRFDKLEGKFYPQQWSNTTFEDSGIKRLNDAAPELLENLVILQKRLEYLINITPSGEQRNLLTEDNIQALLAIKKATE